MKQVNFSHPGGFPLEQETLERLQTAYKSELYEAIKRHLSILPDTNYIIAHAQNGKQGWAVIHQDGEGILYPITGTVANYLKTTKTTTNLIYGDGASQTAYTDYQAEYVSVKGTPITNDTETINYYDLGTFKTVKSIQEIETIIAGIDGRVKTIEATVPVIDNRVKTIETALPIIDTRINAIETDLESYLPLDGSKAMRGDLNLGTHQLYLNNLSTSTSNNLLALNDQNQVIKNTTLLDSLIRDIEDLKGKIKTSTAVPIGMIAIWDKPAPFPDGWEEYIPLRGRMPIGLDITQSEFNQIDKTGGSKNAVVVAHSHTITDVGNVNNGLSGGEITNKISRWDRGSGTLLNGTISTEGVSGEGKNLPPYRVIHFIKYTGNSSDTQKPSIPENLNASNIGTTALTLNWNASTDNIGVTGYLVYKDNGNTLLAELGKDVLTYNVTGLSPNTAYSFHVKAKDAADNISDPASTNATTSPVSTPTVPTLQYAYYGGETMTLQWPNYIDSGAITYELFRSINGGTPMLLQRSTDTFFYDKLSNGVTYSYQIRINHNEYVSGYSNTVTVTGRSS
ncbi:fibronectin type III domain-containing protein [Flavobacterium sp.]|uniref:fibronectin type III domain-containing protein n=1 Tax=Flavobacterium sp. TaxID=239 RepID=UPI0031CF3B4F